MSRDGTPTSRRASLRIRCFTVLSSTETFGRLNARWRTATSPPVSPPENLTFRVPSLPERRWTFSARSRRTLRRRLPRSSSRLVGRRRQNLPPVSARALSRPPQTSSSSSRTQMPAATVPDTASSPSAGPRARAMLAVQRSNGGRTPVSRARSPRSYRFRATSRKQRQWSTKTQSPSPSSVGPTQHSRRGDREVRRRWLRSCLRAQGWTRPGGLLRLLRE
jgi:hypothetical protein